MPGINIENFLAKIDTNGPGGCWLWTGAHQTDGYGSFGVDGKVLLAHRVSYVVHVGEIPKGMRVLHRCDVRACVNPDHLWLGTQRQNVKDMMDKGRWGGPQGSSHPWSKLDEQGVQDIRFLLRMGKKQEEVAGLLGVSPQTVSAIKTGACWAWLPCEWEAA